VFLELHPQVSTPPENWLSRHECGSLGSMLRLESLRG
jgi:hypothetical protein